MEKAPLPIGSLDSKQEAARKKLQGALDAYPKKGQAVDHDQISNERTAGSEKCSNY